MTKSKASKIAYRIFTATFTAVTVVLGLLFIWQVADVYYDGVKAGGQIFTRAIVAKRLSMLSLPVILWIVMAIVAFVLYLIMPTQKNQRKVDPTLVAKNLKKRLPTEMKDGLSVEYALIKKEERIVKISKIIFAVVAFIAVVYGVAYFANDESFTNINNATTEVIKMVKYLFPVTLVVLALLLTVLMYEKYSAMREVDALKKIVKGEKINNDQARTFGEKVSNFFDKPPVVFSLRIAVGVLGVSFIVVGIINGSMNTVFNKAINICTECIGLG